VLRLTANGRNQQQQYDNTGQNKQRRKTVDLLMLFTYKRGLLKTYVDLQTEFAAETRLAERQWLVEQPNSKNKSTSTVSFLLACQRSVTEATRTSYRVNTSMSDI
jgi:hypothetical protein